MNYLTLNEWISIISTIILFLNSVFIGYWQVRVMREIANRNKDKVMLIGKINEPSLYDQYPRKSIFFAGIILPSILLILMFLPYITLNKFTILIISYSVGMILFSTLDLLLTPKFVKLVDLFSRIINIVDLITKTEKHIKNKKRQK